MKPVYIIIGIPGSGKDTQAQLLSDRLHIPQVGAGSIFTEIVQKKLQYHEFIADSFAKGLPIPTDVFFEIMKVKYASPECANGFILSKHAKSIEEEEGLLKTLHELGFEVQCVFYLNISREEAINRALIRLNGVFTDKEPNQETLVRRIDNYISIIPQIVAFYRTKGILHDINGERKIEDITDEMASFIKAGK
jgi:adenylate kinase